jgi:hypothetical protein
MTRPENRELAKWRRDALAGGHWRKYNTAAALAKLERKLANSMAHIGHPRQADLARWRAMQAEIETLKQALLAIRQQEAREAAQGLSAPQSPPNKHRERNHG